MKERDNKNAITVFFVCVENAGRSQIAEGFFKKFAPKEFKGQNAGTRPVSEINPNAVEGTKELVIDINRHKSK